MLGMLLVIVYLIGVYTHIHLLWHGAVIVPVAIGGLAGVFLLTKNFNRISGGHVLALAAVMTVGWLSVIFRGYDEFFYERVKGAVQFSYSLVFAYAFFLEVAHWEQKRAEKLFQWISVCIIGGCILENYTALKILSDSFRVAVFDHSIIYTASGRDIAFFGMERPKLFTTEPSHVTKFLLFTFTMWLGLGVRTPQLIAKVLALALLAIIVTGSPSLVLIFPITAIVIVFLDNGGILSFFRSLTGDRLVAYVILFGVLLAAMAIAATTVLANRFDSILSGEGSAIMRLLAPPFIAFDVIAEYPLWGAGIAGKEMVEGTIYHRIVDTFGVSYIATIADASNRVANAFWLHWIYFGVFGGVLMIFAILQMMKTLGVRHYFFCFLLIALFTQIMGGYVGLRVWTLAFGFMLTSVFFLGTQDKITQVPNFGRQSCDGE